MSLLLDALRKSENQRRKGELPPLDQPLSGSPVIATRARSFRLRTLLFALLFFMLTATAVLWLLIRWSPDEPMPIADRAQSSSGLADSASIQPTEPPPQRQAGSEAAVMEPDGSGIQALPDAEPPQAVASGAADRDTPTVVDEQGAPDAEIEMDRSETGADVETVATQSDPAIETVAVQPESEPAISETQDQPPDPVRGFIYAWELPLDARQDFPDLDVTVHVFAPDPDNRFVLINGERYGEGERLAPGVVLHEITREGALVDFRNYRILLQ